MRVTALLFLRRSPSGFAPPPSGVEPIVPAKFAQLHALNQADGRARSCGPHPVVVIWASAPARDRRRRQADPPLGDGRHPLGCVLKQRVAGRALRCSPLRPSSKDGVKTISSRSPRMIGISAAGKTRRASSSASRRSGSGKGEGGSTRQGIYIFTAAGKTACLPQTIRTRRSCAA